MEIGLILIAIAVLLLYGFVGGSLKSFSKRKTPDSDNEPSYFGRKTDIGCYDVTNKKYDHLADPSSVWHEDK